jgi:hypothetical protein
MYAFRSFATIGKLASNAGASCFLLAVFACLSASSFPAIPQCDGIQQSVILLSNAQSQLSRLYAFDNKITLCWIPSHCGIAGNELADKQANTASKKQLAPALEASLPIVAKDLNAYIAEQGKKWLQNKWDRDCYDRHGIENKLHVIDNKIGEKKYHTFPTRLDEIKYNRIRLGHTRLTSSHLAGGDEPPLCEFCNKPITVKHILSKCPLHAEARKRFFEPHHFNFKKILSRDSIENPQNVIKFLKYSEINGNTIYSQI